MIFIEHIFTFFETYSLPLLVLSLGALSVLMIAYGSTKYSPPKYKETAEATVSRFRDASMFVLFGTLGMMMISLASSNHMYALPEIGALLTALLPFIKYHTTSAGRVIYSLKIHYIVATFALILFVLTLNYADSLLSVAPALGITLASLAFGLVHNPLPLKTYRTMTITASILLVLGSMYSGYGSYMQNNLTSLAMDVSFFVLNFLFLLNEIRVRIIDLKRKN